MACSFVRPPWDRGRPSVGRLSSGRRTHTHRPFCRSRPWLSSHSTVPPPVASTSPFSRLSCRRASVSLRRKPSSPSFWKISGMEQSAAFSISVSRSTKVRPSIPAHKAPRELFPEPGMPQRMRFVRESSSSLRAFSSFSSGISSPVKNRAAAQAWAASMGSPPEQGSPMSSTFWIKAVRRGLYTASSAPSRWGNRLGSTAYAPSWGNIPTGVVLMSTSVSRCSFTSCP